MVSSCLHRSLSSPVSALKPVWSFQSVSSLTYAFHISTLKGFSNFPSLCSIPRSHSYLQPCLPFHFTSKHLAFPGLQPHWPFFSALKTPCIFSNRVAAHVALLLPSTASRFKIYASCLFFRSQLKCHFSREDCSGLLSFTTTALFHSTQFHL